MEIRNLMEDTVSAIVGEIFELEEQRQGSGFCTCSQCRLDVTCYVLNRVKPEYIVSGRGLAYSERETLDKIQKRADIISLAREGWSRVGHRPRESADHQRHDKVQRDLPQGPAFNIPAIIGRAFNGLNFEPLASGTITLFIDGQEALMVDRNWQNPFVFAEATTGNFTFWPSPLATIAAGDRRVFAGELRIQSEGFDPLSHFFEMDLVADKAAKQEFSLLNVQKIPDLLLFPVGSQEGEDD